MRPSILQHSQISIHTSNFFLNGRENFKTSLFNIHQSVFELPLNLNLNDECRAVKVEDGNDQKTAE
jgi:hypothetical protein